MALLERTAQLASLLALFGDVQAGHGRLALIAGDAGSGKTTLVRSFTESIAGSVRAMWGQCDPMTTPRPLGPLLDIAPELGDEVVQALRRGNRTEVFDITLTALASRDTPGVVVFEDLHWADDATLDLVRFLSRRLAAVNLLL